MKAKVKYFYLALQRVYRLLTLAYLGHQFSHRVDQDIDLGTLKLKLVVITRGLPK